MPVGTGYHWYILAHQNVTKLNADDYSTSMTGVKFKLAHKRADKGTWSASPKAQRNRMIKILKQMIEELEAQTDEPVVEEATSEETGKRVAKKATAAKKTTRKPQRKLQPA